MAHRIFSTLLLTMCVLASSVVLAGDLPAPYIASDDNQLLTLGKAKGKRFELKDITWPANPGDAEVCLWKDDKYAAASITIDDNCAPDHKFWLEQGEKHGIKFTWFVITGGVDGKNKSFAGTWAGWQKLLDAGHAVESHTTNHKKSSTEPDAFAHEIYAGSIKALNGNLKNHKTLTIAYPYGDGNHKVAGQYFIAGRGTSGVINNANSINWTNTNKGGISQAYIDVLLTGKTDSTRLKWLNKRDHANKRGFVAGLYHYVPHGKTPEQKKASKEKVEAEVANLAKYKDRIWIDTFTAVALYGQERDSATLTTKSHNDSKIVLALTDRMKDDIFDAPLTLKVRLPDSWKTVSAKQGDADMQATYVSHEGKPYALVYGVPDRGPITVTQ